MLPFLKEVGENFFRDLAILINALAVDSPRLVDWFVAQCREEKLGLNIEIPHKMGFSENESMSIFSIATVIATETNCEENRLRLLLGELVKRTEGGEIFAIEDMKMFVDFFLKVREGFNVLRDRQLSRAAHFLELRGQDIAARAMEEEAENKGPSRVKLFEHASLLYQPQARPFERFISKAFQLAYEKPPKEHHGDLDYFTEETRKLFETSETQEKDLLRHLREVPDETLSRIVEDFRTTKIDPYSEGASRVKEVVGCLKQIGEYSKKDRFCYSIANLTPGRFSSFTEGIAKKVGMVLLFLCASRDCKKASDDEIREYFGNLRKQYLKRRLKID